jgi:hypothetical protein
MRLAPIARLAALCAAALLLEGCQRLASAEHVPMPAQVGTGWRQVASAEDQARLDRIAAAWDEALAAARAAGFGRAIDREAGLLAPDAEVRAAPSPGPYRCRVIRLGAPPPRRAFEVFRPWFCHVSVEGEQLGLTKQTGSERPAGYLWDDGPDRMIFVGAIALGGETAAPAYGANAERNLVGILERVGTFRYRVTMPRSRGVAVIDVLEMVPVVED